MLIYKAGGDALSGAREVKATLGLLEQQEDDVVLVCSASRGITPLLKMIVELLMEEAGAEAAIAWREVKRRYHETAHELGFSRSQTRELEIFMNRIWGSRSRGKDYILPLGERFMAFLLHLYTGWRVFDPRMLIVYDGDRKLDSVTTSARFKSLKIPHRSIIAGYHGGTITGASIVMEDGGSDITAVYAGGFLGARMCVFLKKSSGVYTADPSKVPNARMHQVLSAREARELTGGGAGVINATAMRELIRFGLPAIVKGYAEPDNPGTMIVPEDIDEGRRPGDFIGVTYELDYLSFLVERIGMEEVVGFLRKLLETFEGAGVSVTSTPAVVDQVSVVVRRRFIENLAQLKDIVMRACGADRVRDFEEKYIVTVVAYGLDKLPDLKPKIFNALAKRGITSTSINHPTGSISMMVGVDKDPDEAVRMIHAALVRS